MQVVIEIPESIYDTIQSDEMISREQLAILQMHIMNGTLLPENHGRLVDMSEVLIKLMQFYDGDKTIGQCLDEVSTIIEADKSRK